MNDIKRGFMQALSDFAALSALPTWGIVRMTLPFLRKDHPWHGRRFKLTDWAAGRTHISKWFDAILWFDIVILASFFVA